MLKGIYVLNAKPIFEFSLMGKTLIVLMCLLFLCLLICCVDVIVRGIKKKIMFRKTLTLTLWCFLAIALLAISSWNLRYISGYQYYCVIDNDMTIGKIREFYTILGEENGIFILQEK